jgi:hypothetical protein
MQAAAAAAATEEVPVSQRKSKNSRLRLGTTRLMNSSPDSILLQQHRPQQQQQQQQGSVMAVLWQCKQAGHHAFDELLTGQHPVAAVQAAAAAAAGVPASRTKSDHNACMKPLPGKPAQQPQQQSSVFSAPAE